MARGKVVYAFSHDQMTNIASALRAGFDGEATIEWEGWNRITCKINGIEKPLIVDRREGVVVPDGMPDVIVSGIRLDIQAVVAEVR